MHLRKEILSCFIICTYYIDRGKKPPQQGSERHLKIAALFKYVKQKTAENKKKFGHDYPDIFKVKNLVKKPACAIKSSMKSSSRGGVSFPMPGKSPLRGVNATVRDRTLHSTEICSPQSSLCSLPSYNVGPPSHNEGVGKLGGCVRIGGVVPISSSLGIASACRGGVSFPMPGKSPLRGVNATVRDRTLHSAEIFSPQSSLFSLPSSYNVGPPSHSEGVGKLGGCVRIGEVVSISASSTSRYIMV